MKKITLFIFLFLGINALSNAQCTPDPNCTATICPDTVSNLPNAFKNIAYETTLTINCFEDTAIAPGVIATVDSLIINNITGLPNGLTYFCNSDGKCTFIPNISGCIKISGTATQEGTYPLQIEGAIYGKISGTAASYNHSFQGYKIVVGPVSLEEEVNAVKNVKNIPNPFTNSTKICFNLDNPKKVEIFISDVLGNRISTDNLNGQIGENTYIFNASNLSKGVYYYTIVTDNQKITKKMLIK